MTLFKEKYRIESARLKGWDYSAEGYYYVTLCTTHREPCFGRVVDSDVVLSRIGQIVAEEWLRTAELRPNVELDEWIIMPDHMHGILVITEKRRKPIEPGDVRPRIVTRSRLSADSLGSIIGQFKGACTKRIWDGIDSGFGWQTRFWDRIIRDEEELNRARVYIQNNPLRWNADSNSLPGLYM